MNEQSSGSWENRSTSKKASGSTIFFILSTVVLLGAGIYLFADSSKKTKLNANLTTELSASEQRYADLDARFAVALDEISSYKGKNKELDSLLSVRESAIVKLRASLNQEKKQRSIGEAEYQRQVTDLNTLVSDLTFRVESLQKENSNLIVQRDSLGREMVTNQGTISELQTVNTSLSQKVTVASLLIPESIEAIGTRAKSSGKEAETAKAGKAEEIKVCFDVPENKVADAGEKTFLVRILSPEGVTLAVQDLGSGTFTAVESGEQRQYTTAAAIDYTHRTANICTHWKQAVPFAAGNYTAEIYQDGYLVGKKSFELK